MISRIRTLLALGGLCIAIVLTPTAFAASNILVVLSGDSEIYHQVLRGIRKSFDSDKASTEIEITPLVLSSEESFSLNEEFESLLVSVNLIVSVGTSATKLALASQTERPLLSVLVPKGRYDALIANEEIQHNRYRSVIYLDQPVDRQMSLISEMFPFGAEVGTLISPNKQELKKRIEQSAVKQSIKVNIREIAPEQNIARDIKDLLIESDLGLAIDDPLALDPLVAKWFLYSAYQLRKPIIAFSHAYVKAGALAAIFSTPEQFGIHAGEEIRKILKLDLTAGSFESYSRYFTVEFNDSVARSLGLEPPDKTKITDTLRAKLGSGK